MKGFKQWYVRMVKPEYANRSYRELVEIFGSEFRNTGNIELPGRMTKTGNPAIWQNQEGRWKDVTRYIVDGYETDRSL